MGFINWQSDEYGEFFIVRNHDYVSEVRAENTMLYRHSEEHRNLDHFFTRLEEENKCVYIWRKLVEKALGEDAYDRMYLEMRDHGIEEEFMDKPCQDDIDAYEDQFNEEYKPISKESIIDKIISKSMASFEEEWKYYYKEWC